MNPVPREIEPSLPLAGQPCPAAPPAIPDYLEKVYWWAYLRPGAVRFFERQWLVNLILWGNYARLRDAALAGLGQCSAGRVLQMACVYGDFSACLAARLGADARLDIIDVAAVQLANLRRKLKADPRIHPGQQDASDLDFADAVFDSTLLFFLLHEQPAAIRAATLAEALRVTRPGGRLIIVDYHRPRAMHPLRHLMWAVLKILEPFAHDLWEREIAAYLPPDLGPVQLEKTTFFGGLYQKVVITV
jgi:ubiquinone/menaquinone biosynthesis C-methylase UbiE